MVVAQLRVGDVGGLRRRRNPDAVPGVRGALHHQLVLVRRNPPSHALVCSVGGGCRVGVATAQVYRKEVALERQAELLASLDPEVPAVKAILEHDWSADAAKLGVAPEQMQQNVRTACAVHSTASVLTVCLLGRMLCVQMLLMYAQEHVVEVVSVA